MVNLSFSLKTVALAFPIIASRYPPHQSIAYVPAHLILLPFLLSLTSVNVSSFSETIFFSGSASLRT